MPALLSCFRRQNRRGFLFRLKACPKACSGLRLELWDAALRGCKCRAVPVQYFYPKVNCRVLEDPKFKPQLQLSVFRQVSFARRQDIATEGRIDWLQLVVCGSEAVNGLPLFIFGRTTRFPSEVRLGSHASADERQFENDFFWPPKTRANYNDVSVQFKTFDGADDVTKIRTKNLQHFYNDSGKAPTHTNPLPSWSRATWACGRRLGFTWQKGPQNGPSTLCQGHVAALGLL